MKKKTLKIEPLNKERLASDEQPKRKSNFFDREIKERAKDTKKSKIDAKIGKEKKTLKKREN